MVTRLALDQEILGSNPSPAAIICKVILEIFGYDIWLYESRIHIIIN